MGGVGGWVDEEQVVEAGWGGRGRLQSHLPICPNPFSPYAHPLHTHRPQAHEHKARTRLVRAVVSFFSSHSMSKAPAPARPAPPPKPHHDEDKDEEEEDYVDHAEKLAEAYDDKGGRNGGGGGGGGVKGGHGDHQEKRTLHSGKGTRHKLEILEKAKQVAVPPPGAAKPQGAKGKDTPGK